MDIEALGVNLGKTACSLAELGTEGAIVFSQAVAAPPFFLFSWKAASLCRGDESLRRCASHRAVLP